MEIVLYPDPFLRRRAEPLTRIDESVRERVRRMFELMYEANGVGLAAPQVGWGVRLFVTNVTGEPDPDEERVFVNPEVRKVDDAETANEEEVDVEGCLSIPGVQGRVSRLRRVIVTALDLDGNEFEAEAVDLDARVIQHETDHLDGILFLSKLNTTDRLKVAKKLKKLEKEYKQARG